MLRLLRRRLGTGDCELTRVGTRLDEATFQAASQLLLDRASQSDGLLRRHTANDRIREDGVRGA